LAVKSQQWLISNGQKEFKLIKRESEEGQDSFSKKLREITGREADYTVDSIPLREGTKRVIDIGELAKRIHEKVPNAGEFSAAEFSLEMIEGAEKVRFYFSTVVPMTHDHTLK
jgi:hypothetical protein